MNAHTTAVAPPAGAHVVDDPAKLAAFFSEAKAAHVYGLADTEEPFWSASRWFRRDDAVVGLVGLPGSGALTVYAVATRDPMGTLELVGGLVDRLPSGLLLTGPVGLADTVRRVRPTTWDGPHIRYDLKDRTTTAGDDAGDVIGLERDDAAEAVALMETEPGAAFFVPTMLDHSTFVGVRREGRLVAMAGTHVMSERLGVAAVGAVYVHPAHRGRGFARAVTAGVLRRVGDRVDTIGLNVSESNAPARAIYESLGFRPILTYDEAELA